MPYSDPPKAAYWELCKKDARINSQISNVADETIAYIHFFLIFCCEFKNISENGDENEGQYNYKIPEGWKGDDEYTIKYSYGGSSFMLKGTLADKKLEVFLTNDGEGPKRAGVIFIVEDKLNVDSIKTKQRTQLLEPAVTYARRPNVQNESRMQHMQRMREQLSEWLKTYICGAMNMRRWSQTYLPTGAKNGKRTVRQKTINLMLSRMQSGMKYPQLVSARAVNAISDWLVARLEQLGIDAPLVYSRLLLHTPLQIIALDLAEISDINVRSTVWEVSLQAD